MVVVEGYMDVVALAAAGIEEAVAPLGTALTEAQIELLWRVCETPVLCFDGDTAGQRAATRAMLRALPLLRPGHSLAIARLPAGLDPDDFVKQRGAGALLELLAEAKPLVEALWESERDSAPLATPEHKAGLKARLMAHADTIGDGEVRALYRRELSERFSAFAYPPRVQTTRGRAAAPNRPERLSADSAQRLGRVGHGAHDKLLAATIAGFLRFPETMSRHTDALSRLRPADRVLGALVDLLVELGDAGTPLDRARIATILAQRKLRPPPLSDFSGLKFAFLADGAERALAHEELAEALTLLIERPALEVALVAAEARFAEDPEGAYAEQQRLLKTKLALERRMMQRAAARAGAENEQNGPHGGH
jgi:DNA primase